MNDHPPTGCQTGKAHIESDDGHLDEGDSRIENNRLYAANVLEYIVLVVSDIVHVLTDATMRDVGKAEGRPCYSQSL